MLAAKPPQLVAAPSLSQMQIADLSRLVISSRVSSASFPRVWRAAYSSGGVYSGTRVLSSSTAASSFRSTSAINDEGEQGRCWSTGGVLVGVFMSVLGCRFAGFGGAYRRPSRARAYSFWTPARAARYSEPVSPSDFASLSIPATVPTGKRQLIRSVAGPGGRPPSPLAGPRAPRFLVDFFLGIVSSGLRFDRLSLAPPGLPAPPLLAGQVCFYHGIFFSLLQAKTSFSLPHVRSFSASKSSYSFTKTWRMLISLW